MRGRTVLLVGGAVLVVASGAAAAVGFGGADASTPPRSALPPATATITRGTLIQTETVDGTLGYGDPVAVKAKGSGGTLTWLPAEGSTITRGKTVYKVDDDPVVLLYGATPLYRALTTDVSGADVAEFEKNLAALGYDGFTVDDEYTSATADAVERWQEDLGLEETGTVAPGQVVVAPGEIRVGELQLSKGDQAAGPVLTYTGTTRSVTVDLEVDKQQLVEKGLAATVELPGGARVAGTVSAVGSVAVTSPAASNGDSKTTIDVTVTVSDQKKLGTLDQAPVDVILESDKRADVLTVPINALVALAEGGYGLQVVEGDTTRYIAVKTGMFASGKVEVSGDGVAEGTVVGVPK
ncbi:peptidoglycan-binding domain-containing protein [Phytohabitans sp. ZYX-F-186]|uniref:Peptidoglycan-binding domain-containing protein n=1 Tax=Phytohabitans maris TaxID=3071409 RepID=A0ABU0ZIF6_9ACTN|nr:peptidoglycan-binding domain-containing protein [Phytohabitans sp. ZYX-F-186]MDQ7906840.1 peptidoglycan-binding domain-containing protein [Phytohabitans sp. ZYX-F-186]